MAGIRLIITGGTIDSDMHGPGQKSVFTSATRIPQMLKRARITCEIVLDELMLKDSKDISDSDRDKILARCENSPEVRIVITHGTDTIVETARHLGQSIKNKTVVLVGSVMPYIQENSDALFNLGYALASAQQLPPGVYVAVNGKVFSWKNVRKNFDLEVFEELGSHLV